MLASGGVRRGAAAMLLGQETGSGQALLHCWHRDDRGEVYLRSVGECGIQVEAAGGKGSEQL